MGDFQGPNMSKQWLDDIGRKVQEEKANEKWENATTNLLLQLTNLYFEQQASISALHKIVQIQGGIIQECMERIMTLENNKGKFYAINDHKLSRMMEQLVRRIDALEEEHKTHIHAYSTDDIPSGEAERADYRRFLEDTVEDEEYNAYLEHINTPGPERY